MNKNFILIMLLFLLLLISYPAYALSFQDVTNFFGSIFNSIASFFKSAFGVLVPAPTGGGGGGGGSSAGGGTTLCSSSLSLSITGKDTCTVTATVTSNNCVNRTYEIKDGGSRCNGNITVSSFSKTCTWTVTSGSYSYNLYIDGQYKLSKSVTCSKTPPPTCSDGTLYGQCSSTKPKYCDNGNLVDKCTQCGCQSGKNCNASTNSCYTPQKCSDGTAYNQCSSTKPKYCSSGSLINNCTYCGCPTGQSCNTTTKACYTPVSTCDSTCKSQNYASGNCRAGSSSVLPTPTQFSLITNPRDGTGGKAFHTHNELITMFKTLYDKYPGYASYEPIGKTYEGRDIVLFKIGNLNGGTVLWDGAVHGWEDAGSEVEYLIAKWLLENGTTGTDPTAKRIIERNLILFVPVVNMDSYERGNRNFTYCPYGIDINRNFVKGWSAKSCYSTSCTSNSNCSTNYVCRNSVCTNTYDFSGPSGGSEKETQALRNVFQTYKPKFYVNTHYGGGPLLYYYTGSGSNATLSNLVLQRSNQLSSQTGVTPYPTSQVGSGGETVGDASDYANAWLLEVEGGTGCYGHTKNTYSDIVNTYYPKVFPIFLAMTEFSEVVPTPACQSGETSIGQNGCSSGNLCCCSGTVQKCSDGTSYGSCNTSTKPKYCSSGTLINKCSQCGCSSGTCQADETCQQINIMSSADFNTAVGTNKLQLATQEGYGYVNAFTYSSAEQNLAKNINIKLFRIWTWDPGYTTTAHPPCSSWSDASKTGIFNWTDVDNFVDAVHSIGAEPMLEFAYGAPDGNSLSHLPNGMGTNATTGLPNPDSFAAYAATWVSHFLSVGKTVKYYQVVNEPASYFGWNAKNATRLAYFMDLYNKTYNAMKNVNSNIVIDFDTNYFQPILDYAINNNIPLDAIDYHDYSCGTIDTTSSYYYSDSKIFDYAESIPFTTGNWFGNVQNSQSYYQSHTGRSVLLINSESNTNSAWDGGTDTRNVQMNGTVRDALLIRKEILTGVDFHNHFTFSSSQSFETNKKPYGGYGFGMINHDNLQPYYPYWLYYMIFNNLKAGDALYSSSSSSSNLRTLAWIDGNTQNLLLIHNSTATDNIQVTGFSGVLKYSKIDNAISFLNSAIQTGTINAGDTITLNGYTVMLLQKT